MIHKRKRAEEDEEEYEKLFKNRRVKELYDIDNMCSWNFCERCKLCERKKIRKTKCETDAIVMAGWIFRME